MIKVGSLTCCNKTPFPLLLDEQQCSNQSPDTSQGCAWIEEAWVGTARSGAAGPTTSGIWVGLWVGLAGDTCVGTLDDIGIKEPFMIQLITNILQIFAVAAAVLTGNSVRRRTNLLVTTGAMLVAFMVIGGIGTMSTLTTAGQYVIVVFSFVVIVTFNYGLGPLAYTIAREMAVGRNQNKIMSTSIVVFYFTTWAVSFTAPYLYYDAGLGPMLGFVYAGTTLTCLVYIWFCVGETKGRTSLQIATLLELGIPARKWEAYVFSATSVAGGDEKQIGDSKVAQFDHVESV
jgi:hypothetical protein